MIGPGEDVPLRIRAASTPDRHPLAMLSACLDPLRWLATAAAIAAAVVWHGFRPLTWRRPVRAEFLRFVDLAGVRSLPAVLVTGILVGVSLVAQALYWLEIAGGDAGAIRDVITNVTIREIAPLVIGLILLGRGGLTILAELGEMQRGGHIRALDAQGLDPFLILVVPRVIALVVSAFCLTMVFIVVAFAAGYLAAGLVGASTVPPGAFLSYALGLIGAAAFGVLPAKTIGIGLAIGVVCCLSAMERQREAIAGHAVMPTGFLRAVLAVFLVSALVTIV